MNVPDLDSKNIDLQWKRFCDLLWFSDDLGIWLDISRMNITTSVFDKLQFPFQKAFAAMKQLENGALANKDERRMVGHYWLRSSHLAPSSNLSKLIDDQIDQIETFGDSVLNQHIKTEENEPFTNVLWIGIGGSGLGPVLLINSLQKKNNGMKFTFLDNIDPSGIQEKLELIGEEVKNTLFVVVSKSGGTPEPKICMDQARYFLEAKGFNWQSRAIAITMPNSKLDQLANQENWLKTFVLPDWVGGRTSITSAVGLLTISLIKGNVRSFLAGASAMDNLTRLENIYKNPAALIAAAWYSSGNGKGLRDMVVLPYSDSLEVISKYLQQLVMESLGKRQDRNGEIVNQGLAVYGNKGSTDQHAYVQQLRDGIDNFFVTFIEVLADSIELPSIDDKNPTDYLSGFLQGTRLALSENNRQSITITLKKFNVSTLGALIALFERSVGLYAELININAYDQPGVEAGKKAAADILEIQSKIERLLSNNLEYTISQIKDYIGNNSNEAIFMIIRKMSFNTDDYLVNGDWNFPETITVKKKL